MDKLQVEATSSLRNDDGIPYPSELIILPNPKIQAIINDESPIKTTEVPVTTALVEDEVEGSTMEPSSGGVVGTTNGWAFGENASAEWNRVK